MAAANLHTLDNDILHDLLSYCPDLVSLRNLVLTHPNFCYAFNDRRRLLLRTVFRTQKVLSPNSRKNKQQVAFADAFILRIHSTNPIDNVAVREALWPELERQLPAASSSIWATALLTSYQKAQLTSDALLFAKRSMERILKTTRPLNLETCTFAKAVVRTYMAAKLSEKALELQEIVLKSSGPTISRLQYLG